MGARVRCAWPYELDDARQQGFGADALGAHDEGAGAVDGGSDHLAVGGLFYRHGFAGNHGLVDGAAAFEEHAIDRDFFSGADAQAIAGLHLFERNVFFGNLATGLRVRNQARGSWAEVEQGAKWLRWCGCGRGSSMTWPSKTSVVMAAAASK